MIRINPLRIVVLTASLVALCAIARPEPVDATTHNRPFKATESSVLVAEGPNPLCGPGTFLVQIEGSGVATHLGKYTVIRQHCFNFALGTIEGGTFTFTAANGARVLGTYAGVLVPAGEIILIDASWEITGGTGRFVGASGSGLSQGTFSPTTQEAQIDHVGVITY